MKTDHACAVQLGCNVGPSVPQLLSNAVVFLCGSVVGAFHKVLMERALRQTFQDTLRCLGIRMKLEIEKRQQVRTSYQTLCYLLDLVI